MSGASDYYKTTVCPRECTTPFFGYAIVPGTTTSKCKCIDASLSSVTAGVS